MPFNQPLQRAAKAPSPHRNVSTSSHTTASSTSSLEAAPIKPPPIQTRTAATTGEQLGDDDRAGSRTATYRDRKRTEASTSPTTPRMPYDRFNQGYDRTSSTSGTATLSQSTPTRQHHPYAHLDFPAHLLPAELRPSSSGPDLASLRQKMADAQLERKTAAAIELQRAQRRKSSFHPEVEADDENVDTPHNKRPFSTGDVSATEDDIPPRVDGETYLKPKLRTRSSSAQITHVVSRLRGVTASAGGSTTPISMEARKAVSLQDFTFGEVLGRGSYSTVVLAQQKATHIPYAIKILDQHHLVQEKKTKYAKIERDALVLLGPRQPPRAGSFSSSSSGGVAPQKRRESVAESMKSGKSTMSDTGRKRESGGDVVTLGESTRPTSRRNVSADGSKRVSQIYPSVSPSRTARNGITSNEGEQPLDSSPRQFSVVRRFSEVKEHEEQDGGDTPSTSHAKLDVHRSNIDKQGNQSNPTSMTLDGSSSPEKQPVFESSEAFYGTSARDRLSSVSACMTITPDYPNNSAKRRTDASDGSDRLTVPGQEDAFDSLGSPVRRKRPRYSHPGVVRLHYTFKDESSLYFVLDLAINGELLSFVKKYGSLDIVSARVYAAQIIDTIDFMHERGVIHRDIKPENILLDDELRVKITDFGSAKIVQPDKIDDSKADEANNRKRSFVGTAEYVSPEVLRNEHAMHAADIWAFGCVLFQLIAGRPPFRGATEYLTFQKVLHAEYEYPEEFHPEARNLLERIFKLDPAERPTVDDIKAHRFFSTVRFEDIWTDRMPEIHTGIHAPASPDEHADSSGRGWDDFLTTPETDNDDDPLAHQEEASREAEDLEEPRRSWIAHGGGVGTFSSGSLGTDDSSLVGGVTTRGIPTSSSGLPTRGAKGASRLGLLQRRSSVQQRMPQEKKDMWAHYLAENEQIIYSSPILSRSGLFLPKRRTLVLTSLPRLICVKEDLIKGKMKVKSECVFNSTRGAVSEGVTDSGMPNPKQDHPPGKQPTQAGMVTNIVEKGPRALVVHTATKEYTYIADREDIRRRWMQELKQAQKAAGSHMGRGEITN